MLPNLLLILMILASCWLSHSISAQAQMQTNQLNLQMVRCIHSNEQHAIYVGNAPINGSHFQYNEIQGYLEKQSQIKHNNTYKYRLFAISLLSELWPAIQSKLQGIEHEFYNQFSGRPNQAYVQRQVSFYHHFQISELGLVSPSIVPLSLHHVCISILKYIPSFLSYGYFQNIDTIVDIINKQISYRLYSNVYIYSLDGLDTVNFVAAAYLLKSKNMTMLQTLQYLQLEARHQNRSKNISKIKNKGLIGVLQWYCLYLGNSYQNCIIQADHAVSSQQQL